MDVSEKNFSQSLNKWLSTSRSITIGGLVNEFQEKSFAILFLLLMAAPALPLPTGGITHIFEIIVMLLALELVAGRNTVWLPMRWLNKTLPKSLQTSALPRFTKIIGWVEKYSRPRLHYLQSGRFAVRLMGIVVLAFTIFAFLAPPFSGLDTLPSLGVVLISLGLIFQDAAISLVGLIVGSTGITLVLILGKLAVQLF